MSLSSGMEWLSSLGAAWLPVLADATVKGTVILIVASVVSFFVRRASAATRHLVWFLALVGLLGLPALSVALPGWQVLPAWFGVGRTAALDAPEAARPPATDEPAVPPAAESPPWSGGGGVPAPAGQPAAGAAAAAHGPRPLEAASGTPPAPEAGASRSGSPAMNLWIWILPLWAAGAALSLAPVAIGLVSLRRLRRTSRRVADGPWAALLERLSAELGLKRRVVLLRSGRRSMPMAWGLVRPKLLIPDEAEGWSSECLRAVLLHELAHIKRWDCLTQLVARMACGVYWFNPLAWVALRRMVAEHERACDDVVLAAGGRAPEYAEHLLKVASGRPAVRFSLGVGIALARPSRLEGRLLAILDGRRSRCGVTRAGLLAAVALLVVVLMPLAVLRPAVQAAPDALRPEVHALVADVVAAAAKSVERDSGASPAPAAPPAAPAPAAAPEKPAPEPAPPDEVLKQLGTILELEEQILAGAQERFRVGRGSEEDVGRQQVKVIDAKVRLAERKAELAARPKGDPRPPAPPPSAALAAEIRKHVTTAVAQEEALLALVQERYRVGRATAEEVDRQQVRLAEARLRLTRLPAVPAAAPATPSDASVPAAPPHPAATPILKVRSTDGAAVADVHDGVVRVRLGNKTVEGPTIIISLDPVAAGAPRKGIALTVRDGAVRMSADGNEILGAQITIHPDGRAEVSSREATDASPKAPGTFPLKYQEAGESDSLVWSHSYREGSGSPPEGLKAPPKGLSEKALYFSMPVGGKSVLVVIDKTSPPRLFVDAAGTGDLSGAKPILSTSKDSEPVFGPVTVAPAGKDGPSSRVRFIYYNQSMLAVVPAGYMAGEVKLDGQSYRVAVVDNYVTGRYDNVLRLTDQKALWRWETILAIDLDQDGKFERVTAAGETLPLVAGVHVKDAYYSVKVVPDGSSITLAKVEPQFGVLDAGCPDLNLVLLGDGGFHNLAGSGGKWRLPAGGYRLIECLLARTDAAGATWTLRCGASDGKFGKFDIRPGETLAAQGGPPLVVDVRADPPMDGAVRLQFVLLTRNGQEYSPGPMKNGQRMPAPKFKILDEAGKILAQGNFEYG